MAKPKEDENDIHALDLPQLYTKPAAPVLLSTLHVLALAVPSWDSSVVGEDHAHSINPAGLPSYLTSIIASPLSWIDDENEREEIWQTASKRLTERSGRNAMPPLTRTFQIPVTATGKEEETIPIHLHEPSLISDNLGLKTWAASYLLAKRLASLSSSLPSSHHPPPQQQQQHQQDARPPPRPRVLELGAGTGLVGIAAAAVWGAAVHLTDLPAIEPNLAANVNANRETIERRGGGGATTGVLDWSDQDGSPRSDNEEERYPVILAADPLYSPEHPRMLAQTIVAWLRKGPDARVVVELPVRDAYVPEVEEFRARMDESGLRILEEGEEVGFDDWASRVEGDSSEVRCWWGMWGWAEIESVPTS